MLFGLFLVSFDEEGAGIFAFVIFYAGDPEKHVFSCFNVSQAQNWVVALRQARFLFFLLANSLYRPFTHYMMYHN